MKNNITKSLLIILLGILIYILIKLNIINDYYQITLIQILINIILAVGLNLITGYTGQFSLGHAAFMSIGAYTAAMITLNFSSPFSFYLALISAGLMAALFSFLMGLPILRLKGDYLAIATLGFGEIVRIVLLNIDQVGGASGLSGMSQDTNFSNTYIITILAVLVISNFIHSSHGRACISIREDEIASESVGINTTKYKVIAFLIGGFFAGIAGGLYSSYFYFIKPGIFDFNKSIDILVIVVLGGIGSLRGSIIAAILLSLISAYLQNFPEVRMLLYGTILISIMLIKNRYPNLLSNLKLKKISKMN